MAALKPLIICSKTLQITFFEASTLKIGYVALQVTTPAPKTLFWATKWNFPPFLGKKCGFFDDGGSKTLNNLLPNLAKHVFVTPAPSK